MRPAGASRVHFGWTEFVLRFDAADRLKNACTALRANRDDLRPAEVTLDSLHSRSRWSTRRRHQLHEHLEVMAVAPIEVESYRFCHAVALPMLLRNILFNVGDDLRRKRFDEQFSVQPQDVDQLSERSSNRDDSDLVAG